MKGQSITVRYRARYRFCLAGQDTDDRQAFFTNSDFSFMGPIPAILQSIL